MFRRDRKALQAANPDSHVVRLSSVHFSRGEHVIFEELSLSIAKGKITAILGPSGTGKTTLLHMIGGLLMPDAGDVEVFGVSVPKLRDDKLLALRKRMGLLFQSGALFTGMSVFDNVAFPLREHTALPESAIRDIVLMKLEAVGLRGARDLLPRELSGGMSRRVALARSIALDPDILMYDEPFTGQDPITMGVLVKLIETLNDALGLTSVVVTHDVHEVLNIADYVYIISRGKVVGEGKPDAILHSRTEQVAQFIHGKPDGPVPFHYQAPDIIQDFLKSRAL